ncbi:MAG: hypothetical protein ACYC6F_07985 [Longimicrobiales bacterium]
MNARIRRSALLAALILAAACGRPEAPAADEAPPVETAQAMDTERGGVSLSDLDRGVTTARAMREMPGAVDSILAANGFTRPGFDSLMYAIAADSALARAYTESIR